MGLDIEQIPLFDLIQIAILLAGSVAGEPACATVAESRSLKSLQPFVAIDILLAAWPFAECWPLKRWVFVFADLCACRLVVVADLFGAT